MTTGNQTSDLRYADADGKRASLGLFKSRIWSGGDSNVASSAQKAKMNTAWPGGWYAWKANHASSWQVLPVRGPDGKFSKTNFTRNVLALQRVRAQYDNRFQSYLVERERWLSVKKQEAAHRGTPHNYENVVVRSNDVPCSYRQMLSVPQPWHVGVSASAAFGNPVGPKPCWDANDDNALIEKLRSKLNGAPGFHAGVAVAELERTCKMLANAAITLKRFGQQMRKGDVAGGLRVLFNGDASYHSWFNALPRAAQLYLGLQFGLLPLLDDVKGGARMLGWQAGLPDKPMRIRVRRERKSSSRSSNPVVVGWDRIERGQIVALLRMRPRAIDFSGLTDVASILWERQWMSFVVDWWIPVGGALSALQLSQTLSGTFIVTRTTKSTRSNYTSGSGYSSYQVIGDSSYYRSHSTFRTVNASLIPKMPVLRTILHPNAAVAVKHATEAGALLIVNRKKILTGIDWLKREHDSIRHGELFSAQRGIPGSLF